LGSDAPGVEPEVVSFVPDRPGRVVLCTDGLWNYTPRTSDLAGLVRRFAPAGPAALAHALTDFAVEAGGRDNVTVAVLEIDDPATETQETP
jgi:serine/threonine protein phosphatase PrpC